MGHGVDGRGEVERWCILRMSGPSTMRLVASLQDAGFGVWTPTEHIKRRLPRGKTKEHLIVPMAPTYAFAPEADLPALERITRLEVSPHPRFSIFRYYGSTVLVRHAELHRLRSRQQASYLESLPPHQKTGKPRGVPYDVGDTVDLKEGAFTGFQAAVVSSDGRETKLEVMLFGRATKMTVPTLQLRSRHVPKPKHAA